MFFGLDKADNVPPLTTAGEQLDDLGDDRSVDDLSDLRKDASVVDLILILAIKQ